MYVHKPKDTDKLEHFIKHLVAHAPSPAPRRRPRVARALSPLTGRPRAVAARTRRRFFSCTRRRNVSPRGEKARGDIAPFHDFFKDI
ncbi:hypothetical protein GW17_00044462 [Ensete ventricosum]|nr:hypothetical protein GW17_00044462 [Ensete ventricosum]